MDTQSRDPSKGYSDGMHLGGMQCLWGVEAHWMLLFSTCAHITVLFPLPQGPATPILATTMVSASWSQTGATSSPTTSASALRGTMGCTARTVSTVVGGQGELLVF